MQMHAKNSKGHHAGLLLVFSRLFILLVQQAQLVDILSKWRGIWVTSNEGA